uniref:Uncharacterized protein n=1 Tax=Rhizophora mucronata TaxID=61149 RepID=A0A2P2NP57_RHIMU
MNLYPAINTSEKQKGNSSQSRGEKGKIPNKVQTGQNKKNKVAAFALYKSNPETKYTI